VVEEFAGCGPASMILLRGTGVALHEAERD
jgi:hypothetical protein